MNRCSFGAVRCDAFEKHRIGIEHAAAAGKRFLMVQAELLEFLMIMQIDQQHLDRLFGQMMLKTPSVLYWTVICRVVSMQKLNSFIL